MKIGVQTVFGSQPDLGGYVRAAGRAMEERGFHAVWIPEHALTFEAYDARDPYPYSDDRVVPEGMARTSMCDPMTILSALAMATTTLKLGTGIAILPQRNPVYFAKMATDIDLLSGGRFLAGLGLGWSSQEYEGLGASYAKRGERMREYVEILKTLWCDELSSFSGEYYTLPACVQLPKPAARPHPPIYFGGESDPALRRVAALGDGWLGFRLSPEELAPKLERLAALLAGQGRLLSDIDIIVSPVDRTRDFEALASYAKLGVSQIVVGAGAGDMVALVDQLDGLANELVIPAARL